MKKLKYLFVLIISFSSCKESDRTKISYSKLLYTNLVVKNGGNDSLDEMVIEDKELSAIRHIDVFEICYREGVFYCNGEILENSSSLLRNFKNSNKSILSISINEKDITNNKRIQYLNNIIHLVLSKSKTKSIFLIAVFDNSNVCIDKSLMPPPFPVNDSINELIIIDGVEKGDRENNPSGARTPLALECSSD